MKDNQQITENTSEMSSSTPLVLPDMQEQAPSLHRDQVSNLKVLFPSSPLFVLLKGWRLGMLLLVGLALFGLLDVLLLSIGFYVADEVLHYLFVLAARLTGVSLLIAGVYWELYRRCQNYWIDGYRLFVKKGLLPLRKGSFPLLPITEVYVDRTPEEIVFGLARLVVKTPVGGKDEYSVIEGLEVSVAESFQLYLTKELDRMVFLSEKETAAPRNRPVS